MPTSLESTLNTSTNDASVKTFTQYNSVGETTYQNTVLNTTHSSSVVEKTKLSPHKRPLKTTIASTSSPNFHGIKSGPAMAGSLHRSMFKPKKSFSNATVAQRTIQLQLRNKFASPTDRLLSPCSQKLNSQKSKFLLAKSNPTKLDFGSCRKSEDTMVDSDSDY